MSKRIITVLISVTLALTFAVTAVTVPALLAAEKLTLSASGSIKFPTFKQQQDELKEMGLVLEEVDGKPTLQASQNTTDSVSTAGMQARHADLISKGILRYAIYSGTLCQQSQQSQTGLQLIIILDFTNYNVTVFESGFLKGLTYAILGSKQVQLFGMGSKFEEYNGEGGALTLYDSSNGGAVMDKSVRLTLQGFGSNNSTYIQEKNGETYGAEQYINHYSIRIILPGNQPEPVTLKEGSLTLKGVNSFGGIFSPKQPDCIGLGISHLGISHENHSSVIRIEQGAADSEHFHWMTVTEEQKGFSFQRTLDNILNSTLGKGYADEIFKKPHAYSDFAHLYISSQKTDTTSATINIYDSPAGEINESASDLAAAVRLLYWYDAYINYKNIESMDVKFCHYRRDSNNQIEAEPGVLTYDSVAKTEIHGEPCYAVYCSHSHENSDLIGYFSKSGKFYDAAGNPAIASGTPSVSQ